jgi:hypothetical protein
MNNELRAQNPDAERQLLEMKEPKKFQKPAAGAATASS